MTYHIESPHTKEECLQALDEVLARNPQFLAQFDWGCMAGQHVGWATVDAGSESEARNMVPAVARGKARVIRVGKVTADHINALLYLPPEAEGPTDMPDPYEMILAEQDEEAEEAEEAEEVEEDPWGPEAWLTP